MADDALRFDIRSLGFEYRQRFAGKKIGHAVPQVGSVYKLQPVQERRRPKRPFAAQ
ncbi:MAG: hypothetical protein WDN29_00685 [Methylovirgula sp.]